MKYRNKFIFSAFLALLCACGKYGDPQPPEYFAPDGVENLTVNADLNGVVLAWRAPSRNRQGKELTSIDGYFIKKRIVNSASDITDKDIDDEIIATIKDIHLVELKKLREKAIEEGKISRKISVDEELKHFSYTDNDVKPGVSYLYSVVPYNQGSTEGLVPLKTKVFFKGDSSVITMIETEDSETEKLILKKNKKNLFF